MRKLIVLDGPSCSGKTSIAKEFQELTLPTVWFNVSIDTLVYCLPASVLDRCNNQNDWALVDNNVIFSGTFDLVSSAIKSGANVILDVVISTQARASQLKALTNQYDARIIGISCDLEELLRRADARGDRTHEEVIHGYKKSLNHIDYDFLLDTSELTALEAAKEIYQWTQQQ